ncbi:MetR protein [Histoplasma capsulatum]|uniref:MetR protein n=1 Tax=Ajellomyces capsulatus TaxID=5037 RepID=A0A8A1MCX8_AJECA|nr:MetR protein [Histoplasma capsulatum]
MSGYSGRRAPNFSQYLNDLNTIPSPYDQALQEQEQQQTLFDVDAELALFTNAEFLDFDPVGELPVEIPVKYETAEGSEGTDMRNSPDTTTPISAGGDNVKYIDMLNAPAPANQGTKRKQDVVVPGTQSIDEAARLAQEEDKRRRNTAASARFRIKKKEREKNMERTVKDVTAKNATLEARITQLEMENRWLKNLITEKNGGALADGDIAGMLYKYRTSTEAA